MVTIENEMKYPTVGQAWGIAGMCMLFMVLFTPIDILLKNVAGKDLSFLLYYLLSMGSAFWFAHVKKRKRTVDCRYYFEMSSPKIIILASVTIIAIQVGIISPAINMIPMPQFFKKIFVELAQQNGFFSFIAIVVAAPVLEELIFRGIILDGFLKIYSPLKSILISSVLFGVVHLNPWQFIGAFVIGVFSGWVYFKTKKLSLSMLIHLMNNLMAFATFHLMDAETFMDKTLTELYGGLFNLMVVIFASVMVTVLCIYFLNLEFGNIKVSSEKQSITS